MSDESFIPIILNTVWISLPFPELGLLELNTYLWCLSLLLSMLDLCQEEGQAEEGQSHLRAEVRKPNQLHWHRLS